jgi:cold shock CspA family protein
MKTGKLVRWNDEKGYGFIHTETENRDTFIHISVLSHMSRRPVVGDVIFFDEETDSKGKNKATKAKIEGVPRLEPSPESWPLVPSRNNPQSKNQSQPQPSKPEPPTYRSARYKNKSSRFLSKIVLLILVAVPLIAFQKFTTNKPNDMVEAVPAAIELEPPSTQFECQGKTHCSQMSSCDEAMFYIKNCPNTEMDGDHDGIPCESQWCK